MKKAVIMAGGFGTRLRPLTMKIPKPMVPIMNRPMMEHIVRLLKRYGINEIVSILYFQPEVITKYFEDGESFGIKMQYVIAQADYGTAGAVRNAAEHLDERFIIISGDVLTDFDLSKALEFHIEKKSLATILLTRVPMPLQYGIVMTDSDGKITRFLEKPSWGQVFSDTINTGIYILEPEVLDMIPYREDFDFSKDLFPLMLSKNMPLYGYITQGYWRDIGNLNEYQVGQTESLQGKVDLGLIQSTNDLSLGSNVKIAPTAKFSGSNIIGNNVLIDAHAFISDSIIGDNIKIGTGARISGSTIWKNTEIGDFAELTDCVICESCKIGSSATVSENVFIADNCIIGSAARLNSNIKLWPNKKVENGAMLSSSLVQEEKWMRELFTDARISGLSNVEINPDFGAKLGAALGMAFGKNITLLASRDPDTVSRIMKRTITAGLASVGVNINDLQTTSIPQTRQELRSGRYAAGLHVRRSPRNKDLTDIIIFNKDGRDITLSMAKSIERYFYGEDIKRVKHDEVGHISYPERTNEIYIKKYIDSLDIDKIIHNKIKILIDYSYGLSSSILPSILGKLDVNVLSLHNFVDDTRFWESAEMQSAENEEICKIMKSLGYSLGFKMEPGAEKISIIDERGMWFSSSRLLTILTKLFLETNREREPYSIGISIAATGEIEEIASEYNVKVIRIKNSHSAMMEATREHSDMLFVGGVYGGFIFTDFLFASDGMYTVGKILEMICKTGKKLSELDLTLPHRFQCIKDVSCPWENKGTVMRLAMEHSQNMKRELVEGIKIFLEPDSVLILPDKEKGAFSIIGESSSLKRANEIADNYKAFVLHWRDNK
ncbi:MAG: sugar phosphate nucleotidyltransferase [Candidatus Kapabacteria bacterium]|nr:sugar phosphate nucleotidyltransferase [Candidatus Kapabacteria bacterium]